MGAYRLDFYEQTCQLTITLEGDWDYKEARAYQAALMEYVKNRSVEKVLIDQRRARFDPKCMELFAENRDIYELKSSATAAVLSRSDYRDLRESMEALPAESMQDAPKPFDTIEGAQKYLSNLSY